MLGTAILAGSILGSALIGKGGRSGPHLAWSEVEALKSGRRHAADRHTELASWIEDSEIKRTFDDPDHFYRQADKEYGQEALNISEVAMQEHNRISGSAHASGLGSSGISNKAHASVARMETRGKASLYAGKQDEAGRRTALNEQAYMGLMGQLADSESAVISAQMQLAQRLGQQAGSDEQYRERRFYAGDTENERRVMSELGL